MSSEAPLITIDLASPMPAYEQIAGAIRALLVGGRLKAGNALPPVRQLAIDLAVHFNTVAQAYRILAEEGWLDLRQGRGATVIERSARQPDERARGVISRELSHLVASALSRGLSQAEIRSEVDRLLKSFPSSP